MFKWFWTIFSLGAPVELVGILIPTHDLDVDLKKDIKISIFDWRDQHKEKY